MGMQGIRTLLLTGLLAVAGCGGSEDEGNAVAADTARVARDSAAVAQALTPIRSMSLAEVEFADVAAQRAGMPAVRQYAQTVAADHRALIGALDSVAQTRGTTLAETRETQELANTARMAHSGLENLSGPTFDLAFVRAEVESHRLLMDRLDQQLIPAAASNDLRTLLTDIRAMVDAHLTRARQLLAQQLGEPAEPQTAPRQQQPRPPGVDDPPSPTIPPM